MVWERIGDGMDDPVRAAEGASDTTSGSWTWGFNEYLLGGVIVLTLFTIALGVVLYLLPGDYLQIPELQPAVRVAQEAEFPVGSSRVASWGARVVLVVRSGEQEYAALQGASPLDGCILKWDAVSLRVVSPCNSIVYDLHGNVVHGLTTIPLQRFAAFVRQGAVYVTEP
jgi:nitrite reductase/ring-hydroxylating ferredoxin subunit